jgi:hypothetical protein
MNADRYRQHRTRRREGDCALAGGDVLAACHDRDDTCAAGAGENRIDVAQEASVGEMRVCVDVSRR